MLISYVCGFISGAGDIKRQTLTQTSITPPIWNSYLAWDDNCFKLSIFLHEIAWNFCAYPVHVYVYMYIYMYTHNTILYVLSHINISTKTLRLFRDLYVLYMYFRHVFHGAIVSYMYVSQPEYLISFCHKLTFSKEDHAIALWRGRHTGNHKTCARNRNLHECLRDKYIQYSIPFIG